MDDLAIIAVLILILGLAIVYIIKAKKNGVKCIGCPLNGKCSKKHSSETPDKKTGEKSSCCGNCSHCSRNCSSHHDS